jgi:hypothetical protein
MNGVFFGEAFSVVLYLRRHQIVTFYIERNGQEPVVFDKISVPSEGYYQFNGSSSGILVSKQGGEILFNIAPTSYTYDQAYAASSVNLTADMIRNSVAAGFRE